MSPSFEMGVTNAMACVDHAEIEEEEETGELFFTPQMCKTRFRAKVVLSAKAEFGYIPRSEANRLMVRKHIRDLMRSHGMRDSHIARNADICVSLFFIPSAADIDAHKIKASYEAITRTASASDAWQSAYLWFTEMLGFKSE